MSNLPYLNCKPASEDTRAFLDQFRWFEISPVRNDGECCVMCGPDAGEFYTIYGRYPDGEACAVHDDADAEAIAWAAALIQHETGKPFRWFDAQNGPIPEDPERDFAEIADSLAEAIHDDIADADAPDARDDDFDNHPLSAIREALNDVAEEAS